MDSADWIAQFLAEQQVEAVFEVVGGMIANIIDAVHRDGRVRIVSCHHEQAAGFAAEAHARITGVPGVAMATSGPGALNLLTALGSCHFDSTPAVFITGQVNTHEQKGGRPLRQLGFQETDIVTVATPIAKAAWRVETVDQLPGLLRDSFELARSGRPGPVLLDIPFDLQRQQLDVRRAITEEPARSPAASIAAPAAEQVLRSLATAQRPLILAGGGLRSGWAVAEFRSFVETLGVPVVHSLMGVDVLPFTHPLRVGMIGTYGNRWANIALAKADVLLVLGSRLDIRQTGADTAAFTAGRLIYHVDIDPAEVNSRVSGCRALIGGLRPSLEALTTAVRGHAAPGHDSWCDEIADQRAKWPDTGELEGTPGINPNLLMHQVSQRLDVRTYVTDVGQHQMWAAQSLELGPEQRFLTSGGMGAMGSGLPMAIGASLAGGAAALIAGDGGFQLNIQELQTVARNELPLKCIVLNNNSHGMVRQFQDSYFGARHRSTVWGYSAPSFVAVARAYGLPSRCVDEPAEVPSALDALEETEGPSLLEVMIDARANAYPKIAFGHPISEMEPFASPKAREAT